MNANATLHLFDCVGGTRNIHGGCRTLVGILEVWLAFCSTARRTQGFLPCRTGAHQGSKYEVPKVLLLGLGPDTSYIVIYGDLYDNNAISTSGASSWQTSGNTRPPILNPCLIVTESEAKQDNSGPGVAIPTWPANQPGTCVSWLLALNPCIPGKKL